jgi:hypothetical protein
MRILIRVFPSTLLPAFIGSDFLATTERSAISQPIGSAFPFGLYLPYLVRVCVKETTRLPSVIYTFCSVHPDPNHVDEPCRSYPFPVFLQGKRLPAKASPFCRRVALHRRHLWFTLHSGLDFACRPFGFRLTANTLSVLLLRRVGPLLRLRHFKG